MIKQLKKIKKINKNGKECWLQRFPTASLPLELAVVVRPLIGYSCSNDRTAPLRPLCSPSPTYRQKCPDLIPDIMTTSLCQLLAASLQPPWLPVFNSHGGDVLHVHPALASKTKMGKNLTGFDDRLSFYITMLAYLEIKSTQHAVIHFHSTDVWN